MRKQKVRFYKWTTLLTAALLLGITAYLWLLLKGNADQLKKLQIKHGETAGITEFSKGPRQQRARFYLGKYLISLPRRQCRDLKLLLEAVTRTDPSGKNLWTFEYRWGVPVSQFSVSAFFDRANANRRFFYRIAGLNFVQKLREEDIPLAERCPGQTARRRFSGDMGLP